MKKLGLVGGTGYESTIVYYREINRRLEELTQHYPQIAIESVDLVKALTLAEEGKYKELSDYLGYAIKYLDLCDADIIALTAGTMHIVYKELEEMTNKTIVSISEVASEYALRKNYKKVGLLGTKFTMDKDFMSAAFEARNIHVVRPLDKEKELIHSIITQELEYGNVINESVEKLQSIIQRMIKEEHIDAIILGCTELPLALNKENAGIDVIDIMELHIDKLVHMML